MSQIFWGTPHQRVPVINGVQFHFYGAYIDKKLADKVAEYRRKEGRLARVQKKSITSRFGNKEKVIGHCYVVFVAASKIRR